MNLNLVAIYRIAVIGLLLYLSVQFHFLRAELKDNFDEIDMVISKLDYVESDINSAR